MKQPIVILLLVLSFSIEGWGQSISVPSTPELKTSLKGLWRYQDMIPIDEKKVSDDPESKFRYYLNLVDYYLIRDIDQRQAYLEKAKSLYHEVPSKIALTELKLVIAECFWAEGDYTHATEELMLAIAALEKEDPSNLMNAAKNILAKLERVNKNLAKAKIQIQQIIADHATTPKTLELAHYHLTFANLIGKNGLPLSDVENNINKAKKIFEALNSQTGMAMADIKYGRLYKIKYMETEDSKYFDLAVEYARKAITVFEHFNQTNNIAYGYYTLATSHSLIGDHQGSIPFYKKALPYFKQEKDLNFSKRIYQHLFVAYSILGKNETAMEVNRKYISIRDSIFNIEKRQLIADAQIKFDTEKIKSQKELAELQSLKNKNLFIGSLIIASLLLLTGLIFLSRARAQKKAELVAVELKETQNTLALEKQYRNAELKALKAQMNPHFIFNALNSIQDYIVLNQKNLASDYLGKFADLIRNYLHFSDTGYISISDEVKNLKLYLELEKLRFEEKLNYSITLDEVANAELIMIPTMLIQPYVENALKHGLLHKPDNRRLNIHVFRSSDAIIQCIIEDNGIGRKEAHLLNNKRNKMHQSFAHKATADRLNLLNYDRANKISVEIIDLQQEALATGTKVILRIPIIENFHEVINH